MGDSGPFTVGEKVLVPHTDKFYEAKIQKAQRREDGLWYYFLHYLGWNKKWDEWVEETGLKRPGEAVVTAAPAAAAAAGGQAGPAGAAGVGMQATASPAFGAPAGAAAGAVSGAGKSKSKQRKSGVSGEAGGVLGVGGAGGAGGMAAGAAGADSADGQLQIELPAALQKQLLDQYDAIHDDNKLLQLPRRPTVMQVFQQYVQYVREKQGVSQAEEDLVAGLQVYFDKALWQCLLYKAERQQADMVLAAGQAPSAVYGAEHLLRLIVKLPELLPHTGATEEALQLLISRVEDLLTYMQVHADRIFLAPGSYISVEMYGAAAAAATVAALPAAAAVSGKR